MIIILDISRYVFPKFVYTPECIRYIYANYFENVTCTFMNLKTYLNLSKIPHNFERSEKLRIHRADGWMDGYANLKVIELNGLTVWHIMTEKI
jgi:hypothetical protein